jgi:peptidylprolyl isomerase
MPAPRRLVASAAVSAIVLASALTGCGSSTSTSSSATTATGGPATAASSATDAPATTAQAPGMPLLASGPVPAVTGATDLTKEPTIAAGTGTPPSVPTGKDLVVGTGPAAASTATVKVQYVGALYSNGTVFDASWTDSGPTTFPLDQVVPGFKDAITGMQVGGRREVVIPPADGYGAAGSPPRIPPNSTLVFVIDLLAINPSS